MGKTLFKCVSIVGLMVMTLLLGACGEAATPTNAPTTTAAGTTVPAIATTTPVPATAPATATAVPPTSVPPATTPAPSPIPPGLTKLPYLVIGNPSANGSIRSAADGVLDKDGNLYVTDYITRKLYKFDKNFAFKGFIEPDATGRPMRPYYLTLDAVNNLYVVDYDNGLIYKYDPAGKNLGQFGDKSLGEVQAIAADKAGNIYTITSDPLLVKYDPAGNVVSKTKGQNDNTDKLSAGQFNYVAQLRLDDAGNIYLFEKSNPYRVQKFGPDMKFLNAYTVPKDKEGKPNSIRDVLFDSDGSLLVVVYQHLYKFGANGKLAADTAFDSFNPQRFILQPNGFIALSSSYDYSGVVDRTGKLQKTFGKSNVAAPGQFSEASSVAVDADGSFFVADYYADRIQKFSKTGKLLMSIDQQSAGQSFNSYYLALDKSGNIYTAGGSSVTKFSPTGQPLLTFGKDGKADGQFDSIRGLALDDKGNIYVGDDTRAIIQKFSPTGAFVEKYSLKEKDTDMVYNVAMAFDQAGNLYVGRGSSSGILILGPDGKIKGQLSPNNKLITDLSINALALDGNGTIYALESSPDHSVVIIDKDGQIKSSLGGEGVKTLEFLSPDAIAIDSAGNLYIAEATGARVQRWNPNDATVKPGDTLATPASN